MSDYEIIFHNFTISHRYLYKELHRRLITLEAGYLRLSMGAENRPRRSVDKFIYKDTYSSGRIRKLKVSLKSVNVEKPGAA